MTRRARKSVPVHSCPCGSGRAYDACCGRYLDQGLDAPSCEALMRSRYTAFVRGDADYLLRTWHPDSRPPTLALDEEPAPKWLGLRILAVEDEPPMVEFVARYKVGGRAQRLHERSRFVYAQGRWFYRDGVLDPQR